MKILLVDDHAVVREGVRRLLSVHFDPAVLESGDVEHALQIYQREAPDLVVLDLNLGGQGGLEFLRRVLITDPSAKVLIFSMHAEPVYAVRALRAGARGYVSKSAPADELIAAVRKITEGGQYVDRDIAGRIAVSQITGDDPLKQLTIREVEILRLLGQGKSLTAISEALGLAYKTVANICSQMKVKLGVERTADLIRLAVETLRS
jgi:two-component system, NarL family, invasion response regulator UvrY